MVKKILAFLVVLLILVGGVWFAFSYTPLPTYLSNLPVVGQYFGPKEDPNAPADISYWGLFEPYEVYEPVFVDYQNQNPNVTIDYEQKVFDDLEVYKDSLLAKLRNGDQAPDIVRIHISWVEEFSPYLEPAPSSVITADDFKDSFYVPALSSSVIGNKVYAIPLMYDSLALLYNRDIFDEAGVSPPSTWTDFRSLSTSLTEYSNQRLVLSGAAVGSADNIAHFSDILGLLMNQSQIELPRDMETDAMKDVILFYTNFVTELKSWDRGFAYSPLSFAQGSVAMMFAPSWQLLNIIENNPSLNVGVAPVPQIVAEGSLTTDSYPNFWVEAVNVNSDDKTASWKLIKHMSEREQQLTAFNTASNIRAFGEPFSLVSLQGELSSDPYLAPYYTNVDNGIVRKTTDLAGNNMYVNVLRDVVEGVLNGEDLDELLSTAKQEYERLESLGN